MTAKDETARQLARCGELRHQLALSRLALRREAMVQRAQLHRTSSGFEALLRRARDHR